MRHFAVGTGNGVANPCDQRGIVSRATLTRPLLLLEGPSRGPLGNCVRSIGRPGRDGRRWRWQTREMHPPVEGSPTVQQEAEPQRIAQLVLSRGLGFWWSAP